MNQLGELAHHIWDIEFGDHTTALERERNALLISGYLEVNIGQLNTLINTDFYVNEEQDSVVPELKYEEKAIFTQLYLKDYMNKQARNILRNAASSQSSNESSSSSTTDGVTDWIELREGDTSIKRSVATSTSKNTSAQIFQKSAAEANQLLKELVHSYNMYGSVPLQVAGIDGGEVESTYVRSSEPNLTKELEKLKTQFKLLSEAFVKTNESTQEELNSVRNQITSQAIEGFAKTIPIPKDSEDLFIDWSTEFFPPFTPTVLATLRSLDADDPIIAYRIEGGVSLGGVRFAFSSQIPSHSYALEVAAFIIDSAN
jgi:hypothetical protein